MVFLVTFGHVVSFSCQQNCVNVDNCMMYKENKESPCWLSFGKNWKVAKVPMPYICNFGNYSIFRELMTSSILISIILIMLFLWCNITKRTNLESNINNIQKVKVHWSKIFSLNFKSSTHILFLRTHSWSLSKSWQELENKYNTYLGHFMIAVRCRV